MMLEAHLFVIADGRQAVPAYVAQASRRARGICAVKDGETDWSALMIAVRDAGDRAAFAQLFGHFAPRVKSYLMKSGASSAQAEECAQDVMTTLWQKARMFDAERASVSTWIFTIARNRMIDMVRRDRRPDPEPMPWDRDDEPDQAEVYAAAEESRVLTAALAELPEKQRSLIQRAFYGDLSHSEIAVETGLPLGTIKSRIRLALDRLRARMSES
ncbi:MAG: sigma-70 family RNA polymerase sigma factor [Cypionkella sp.]